MKSCAILQGNKGNKQKKKKACVPFDQKHLLKLLAWSIHELRGSEG